MGMESRANGGVDYHEHADERQDDEDQPQYIYHYLLYRIWTDHRF